MWAERECMVVGLALSVQILGVIGVTMARVSQRPDASRLCAVIAVTCMVLVGVCTLTTMEACGNSWLTLATTLPLMAVGATLDVRKAGARAAF